MFMSMVVVMQWTSSSPGFEQKGPLDIVNEDMKTVDVVYSFSSCLEENVTEEKTILLVYLIQELNVHRSLQQV